MNREILFRGQRVDNKEWVKGFLVKIRNSKGIDTYAIKDTIYHVNDGYFNVIPVEVIPETVGFASSRKDENDKRIFHGDRVEFTMSDYIHGDKTYTGAVEWNGDEFMIKEDEDGSLYPLSYVCDQDDCIKIIDNIYQEGK